MGRDVITLMGTAGVDIAMTDNILTVKELLDRSFATGTQQAKRIPPAPSIQKL